MPQIAVPAHLYMSAPVATVTAGTRLSDAWQRLDERQISSLAVVDAGGQPVGVITRSDLLRIGRREAGARGDVALLELPDRPVADAMTTGIRSVAPADPVSTAAALMNRHDIHRVFVVDGGSLAGVISTLDVMRAIRDDRQRTPIAEHMSKPLFTVRVEDPLSLAAERLAEAHITGLVVMENDWPVGVFTQLEEVAAKDLPPSTPVEEAMNAAFVCLPESTPLHRAAEQAIAMRVRRIIAVRHRGPIGILTGLDFAHAAHD